MINTRKGIFRILIGIVIQFIPFVSALGTLFILIGVIHFYNGRNEFGPVHKKNIIIGLMIFVIGFICLISYIFLNLNFLINMQSRELSESLFVINITNYIGIIGDVLLFISLFYFVYYFSKPYIYRFFQIGIVIFLIGIIYINFEPIDRSWLELPFSIVCRFIFITGYLNIYNDMKNFRKKFAIKENKNDKKDYLKVAKKEASERGGRVMIPMAQSIHYYKSRKEIDNAKKELELDSEIQLKDQPKAFNYYCSACLYQTNKFNKICPKCREGRLMKTR